MNLGIKRLFQVIAALAVLYVVSFVFVFEVLCFPVHNQSGWLGPKKRYNPQVSDIGKIYCYDGTDMGFYRSYRPLCIVWLWFNGLADR